MLNSAILSYYTGRHGDIRLDGTFSPRVYWGDVTGVNEPRIFKVSVRWTF